MRREYAGALSVLTSTMFFDERKRLVDPAAKERLPARSPWREGVDSGGLMAYGPNIADLFRPAAYVDRILKGAKPGDLPVEQRARFELVINVQAAKAIGLTVPPSVLARLTTSSSDDGGNRDRRRSGSRTAGRALRWAGEVNWLPSRREKGVDASGAADFAGVQTADVRGGCRRLPPGVLINDVAVADGWEMQLARCKPDARLPRHVHRGPEFVYVIEGKLAQAGRRLGPGWASVARAGSVEAEVSSGTGCIFLLVDQA